MYLLRLCALVISCGLFLPTLSLARFVGPYTGQVIDSQTGEPISGASVLIYSEVYAPRPPMGTEYKPTNVKLVYTDSEGKYSIPKTFANTGLMGRLDETHVIIYEPGYQAYIMVVDETSKEHDHPFKTLNNTVKLERIPSRFSHKHHVETVNDALKGIYEYPYTHVRAEFFRRVEWEERKHVIMVIRDSTGGIQGHAMPAPRVGGKRFPQENKRGGVFGPAK